MAKVKVTIEWRNNYNPRRYGKPWVARIVEWEYNASPKLEFGEVLEGKDKMVMTLYAESGDIIRYGQRDNRPATVAGNTVSEWAVVQPDGSFRHVSQAEARELYDKQGSSRRAASAETVLDQSGNFNSEKAIEAAEEELERAERFAAALKYIEESGVTIDDLDRVERYASALRCIEESNIEITDEELDRAERLAANAVRRTEATNLGSLRYGDDGNKLRNPMMRRKKLRISKSWA